MSKAHLTYYRKKKKSWKVWFLQVFLVLVVGGVLIFTIFEAFKTRLFDLIIETLLVDTKVLILLAANVFVVGGIVLVLIYQWVERDNIRFRTKQKAYRSRLVCKDYYRSVRRVKVDQFMIQIPDDAERKLEVDHDLKKSTFVTLDQTHIVKEARQTYIAFVNGRLSGVFKTYFSNGNILAEVRYRKGMLDGRCVVYYPNKIFHTEKHFREGKLHGVFRAWDEDGAIFFEIEYEDDIQHGFDKIYRKNGTIEYEDTYNHGKLLQRKTFDEIGHFKYLQKYGVNKNVQDVSEDAVQKNEDNDEQV